MPALRRPEIMKIRQLIALTETWENVCTAI